MAVTRIRTSTIRTRSAMASMASSNARPNRCSSWVRRNSPATGSPASSATILRPDDSGWPARIARPSMSIASGSSSSNL